MTAATLRLPTLHTRPHPSTRAVAALARGVGSLSRVLHAGSGGTLPGRVTLALLPDPLRALSVGRQVLLVSGTNGKTTTTRLLAAALGTRGPVLTNSRGDNLLPGLVGALALGLGRPGPAVLEVDEAVLPTAAAGLVPQVVVLLNLSRDQLDRNAEVAGHVQRWTAMLRSARTAAVVANADDPLVTDAVLTARPEGAGVLWVAAGQPWRADCPRCPRCGAAWADGPATQPGDVRGSLPGWACSRCAFRRPPVTWAATTDAVLAGGRTLPARLQLPGRANIGNAAMAAAAASHLGVAPDAALAAMRTVREVSGRYLHTRLYGTQVSLLLAKNPAGWAEVLDQLAARTGAVVVAVNAQSADGTDPSWLWDVPFERLRGRPVVAAGERAADVAVRLLYAGVEHTVEPDPLRAVQRLGAPSCDVAANYTAFTRVRGRLLTVGRPVLP